MIKKMKFVLMFALALSLIPVTGIAANEDYVVSGDVALVGNLESFRNALKDEEIKTIKLVSDIILPNTGRGDDYNYENQIVINRGVTIDGQHNTITGKDGSNWAGHYLLHAAKVPKDQTVIIKDIKLTGGNAGILVAGSNVVLEGTIDVSGNGFGGVDVSTTEGIQPTLDITKAEITHTSENKVNNPAIWVEKDVDAIAVTYPTDGTYNVLYDQAEKGQTFFLVNPYEVNTNDTLRKVFAEEVDSNELRHVYNIKLGKDIVYENNQDPAYLDVLNITKDNVTFDGGKHTLSVNDATDNNKELLRHVLQVYEASNVTIKDINLTGGYSGLNVVSSDVVLEGLFDVTGNTVGVALGRGTDGKDVDVTADVTKAQFIKGELNKDNPTISLDKQLPGQAVDDGKGSVSLDFNPGDFYEFAYNDTHVNYFLGNPFEANFDELKEELNTILEDNLSEFAPVFVDNTILFSRTTEEDLTADQIVDIVSTLIAPNQLFAVNGQDPVRFDTQDEINEYIDSILNPGIARNVEFRDTVDLVLFDEDGVPHALVLQFNEFTTAPILPIEPIDPSKPLTPIDPSTPNNDIPLVKLDPSNPKKEETPLTKLEDATAKVEDPITNDGDSETPEVPKTEEKTPGTGITNTAIMNLFAITASASLLVVLKRKKLV